MIVITGVLGLGPAGADPGAVVEGNGLQQSMACAGGPAVVRGNGNTVAFTGTCSALLVEGLNNSVRLMIEPGASVTVHGNGNTARYRVAGGGADARIESAGQNNTVGREVGTPAPPPAPAAQPPIAIQAEGDTRDIDCTGRDVVLQGNNNRYVLRGGCRSLTVRAERDHVEAEMQPGARIDVEGRDLFIGWLLSAPGDDPMVSLAAESSQVVRIARLTDPAAAAAPIATPPVPQSPPPPAATASPPLRRVPGPPIVLKIDAQARDVDCAGREVRIDGSKGIYVLRGGCRLVTVSGQNNRVQAEIQPGGRMSITGSKNLVAYVVLGGGSPPAVTNSGADNQLLRIVELGALRIPSHPPPQGSVGESHGSTP